MLAELQQEQGDIKGASQTLEEMVKLPGLPPEMKQALTLDAANLLLRTKDYARRREASGSGHRGLPADDPQRPRLQAYMVLAQMKQGKTTQNLADLNKILQASSDPETRGVVHNLLGDYYIARKPPRARKPSGTICASTSSTRTIRRSMPKPCTTCTSFSIPLKQDRGRRRMNVIRP